MWAQVYSCRINGPNSLRNTSFENKLHSPCCMITFILDLEAKSIKLVMMFFPPSQAYGKRLSFTTTKSLEAMLIYYYLKSFLSNLHWFSVLNRKCAQYFSCNTFPFGYFSCKKWIKYSKQLPKHRLLIS